MNDERRTNELPTDPAFEPDPVEPDPVEPDPVEPDPVETVAFQAAVAQQAAERRPLPSTAYDIDIIRCAPNAETIPAGIREIPAGEGYDVEIAVTNRETTARQYQLRVTLHPDQPEMTEASTMTSAQAKTLASLDSDIANPGQTVTVRWHGPIGERFWPGFTCDVEVWPSLIQMIDQAAVNDVAT